MLFSCSGKDIDVKRILCCEHLVPGLNNTIRGNFCCLHCRATGHNINPYNVKVLTTEDHSIKRHIRPATHLAILYVDRHKIADIWHVRYRRLNSPACAKCDRSRNFLRLSLRIASKMNKSDWVILSHDFSKCPSMEPGNKVEVPHRRDGRKKSPGVSASIGGQNRLRFSLAIKFAAIGV